VANPNKVGLIDLEKLVAASLCRGGGQLSFSSAAVQAMLISLSGAHDQPVYF
jgi:hypothetical protein